MNKVDSPKRRTFLTLCLSLWECKPNCVNPPSIPKSVSVFWHNFTEKYTKLRINLRPVSNTRHIPLFLLLLCSKIHNLKSWVFSRKRAFRFSLSFYCCIDNPIPLWSFTISRTCFINIILITNTSVVCGFGSFMLFVD
jgi:hypothetical protein